MFSSVPRLYLLEEVAPLTQSNDQRCLQMLPKAPGMGSGMGMIPRWEALIWEYSSTPSDVPHLLSDCVHWLLPNKSCGKWNIFCCGTFPEVVGVMGNCPAVHPLVFVLKELVVWLFSPYDCSWFHLLNLSSNSCSVILHQCLHLIDQLKGFKLRSIPNT